MAPDAPTMLITGGVRSGKSTYAERQLAAAAGPDGSAVYVAPGPIPDPAVDADWAARVAAHRARRPASWTTIEGTDLSGALAHGTEPVLIDCLGTWVTAVIDELDGWEKPPAQWRPDYDRRVAALCDAWRGTDRVIIAVSNEVGWGVVPAFRSGRLFADLLGELNRTVADIADRVVLVVAGRPLVLPDADHGRPR